MTCKDCVHYEVCLNEWSYRIIDFQSKINYIESVETKCHHFKPQSRFVELPCEVGSTVYVITNKRPCYACYYCTDICHWDCHYEDRGDLIVKKAKVRFIKFEEINKILLEIEGEKDITQYDYTCWFTDIGKTVFLSPEEAENALAERSKE